MPTAHPAATAGLSMSRADATPIAAQVTCPATTGQGWESWPWGTANSNTALAPIDATIKGAWSAPTKWVVISMRSTIETTPPMPETAFSLKLTSSSSNPSQRIAAWVRIGHVVFVMAATVRAAHFASTSRAV